MTQEARKRTYLEKLKDPQWQKTRLLVMSRAGWQCEACGEHEKTLHVHHKIYVKGREPWEYDLDQLSCLCAECHEDITFQVDRLDSVASRVGFNGPFGRSEAAAFLAGFSDIDFEAVLSIPAQSESERRHLHAIYKAGFDLGGHVHEVAGGLTRAQFIAVDDFGLSGGVE